MLSPFNQPNRVTDLLKQVSDLHDRALAPVRDFQSRLPKLPLSNLTYPHGKLPAMTNKESNYD